MDNNTRLLQIASNPASDNTTTTITIQTSTFSTELDISFDFTLLFDPNPDPFEDNRSNEVQKLSGSERSLYMSVISVVFVVLLGVCF